MSEGRDKMKAERLQITQTLFAPCHAREWPLVRFSHLGEPRQEVFTPLNDFIGLSRAAYFLPVYETLELLRTDYPEGPVMELEISGTWCDPPPPPQHFAVKKLAGKLSFEPQNPEPKGPPSPG